MSVRVFDNAPHAYCFVTYNADSVVVALVSRGIYAYRGYTSRPFACHSSTPDCLTLVQANKETAPFGRRFTCNRWFEGDGAHRGILLFETPERSTPAPAL